jgi:hypothetical protein
MFRRLGVGDELCDLSDSDSLTLVAKCEASELGVVFEALYTDVSSCASNLQARNDAHAFGRETCKIGSVCAEQVIGNKLTWCLLGSSAGALLQFMQQRGDGDLFLGCMNV